MLPIIICRHYNVDWLDSHTCRCSDCGKRGQWTEQGFAIWIRETPMQDRSKVMRDWTTAKVA